MGSDIQLRLDEMGPEDMGSKNASRVASTETPVSGGETSLGASQKASAESHTLPLTFTSPLSRLFSRAEDGKTGQQDRPENNHSKEDTGRSANGDDILRTHAEEFDELRRQLEAMREGQDRLEDMLRRFVSAGDTK